MIYPVSKDASALARAVSYRVTERLIQDFCQATTDQWAKDIHR